MVFSSTIFLFFFLPLALLSILIIQQLVSEDKRIPLQNVCLLFFSLLFYACGEPFYVLIMIFSIFLNYYFGKAIGLSTNKRWRKQLLGLAILINLLLICIFKYLSFGIEVFNGLIANFGLKSFLTVPPIPLPIGISFFTFQGMSYVIDVYRNETPYQKRLLNLGLYISFFPQLIAGPIIRYHDVNLQIENRKITIDGMASGFRRFIIGIGKKVLIANVMAEAADEIFALSGSELTLPLAWIGVLAYTFQIYFDFSGYSDMAIGLGRIFGFQFLENFNYPYVASSIRAFWRRWHISLSTWFRDYLYIPLGGGRVNPIRVYLNQFVVFFLCGLWHGASWNFVLWGLYHGVILSVERIRLGQILKNMKGLNHVYTFFMVMVGWILFRAETLGQTGAYMKAFFGFAPISNNPYLHWKFFESRELMLSLFLAVIGMGPITKICYQKFLLWLNMKEKKKYIIRPNIVVYCIRDIFLLGVFALSVLYITGGSYNTFIYFRF